MESGQPAIEYFSALAALPETNNSTRSPLTEEENLILSLIIFMDRARTCLKCKTSEAQKEITKHHIFPKRFFGNGKRNNHHIRLCRSCHDELERLIPFAEEKPRSFFLRVLWSWINEKPAINAA